MNKIKELEADFSYQIEFNIDGYRESVESILKENFPKAKFYHHDWNGNNFSAWLLMIDESWLRIRVNYGAGGHYLVYAVDEIMELIEKTIVIEPKKIAELEEDFGVIRATRQKVKALIPHPNEPQAKGFCICPFFEDHYDKPTFSVSVYSDYGMIPAPRWALFEVVGGRWFMVQTGDYAHRVDEMIEVLISVFGGERG